MHRSATAIEIVVSTDVRKRLAGTDHHLVVPAVHIPGPAGSPFSRGRRARRDEKNKHHARCRHQFTLGDVFHFAHTPANV